MQLLDNLLENTPKEVNLKIKVDEMTENEMQDLITLIKSNPGKQSFSMRLIDQENRLACSLKPSKLRINAQDVLTELDKLSYVEFELN